MRMVSLAGVVKNGDVPFELTELDYHGRAVFGSGLLVGLVVFGGGWFSCRS